MEMPLLHSRSCPGFVATDLLRAYFLTCALSVRAASSAEHPGSAQSPSSPSWGVQLPTHSNPPTFRLGEGEPLLWTSKMGQCVPRLEGSSRHLSTGSRGKGEAGLELGIGWMRFRSELSHTKPCFSR